MATEQPERVGQRALDGVHARLARYEADLATARRELARAHHASSVGRVALGALHEFNNALTCVLSFNQLGEGGGVDAGECRREIDVAARRAAQLARQLLAVGRGGDAKPRTLRVADALEELRSGIGRTLGSAITCAWHIEAEGSIRIDPVQLAQVLLNLATNARDAMQGRGHLRFAGYDLDLDVQGARELGMRSGACVVIEVIDDGSGIDSALLPRVFDSFVSTKASDHGTGLGLTLSRDIAQDNGGALTLEPGEEKGAIARLWLPRVADAARATERDRAADDERPTLDATILVVEPRPDVRYAISAALEACGGRVIATGDPGVNATDIHADLTIRGDDERLALHTDADGSNAATLAKPLDAAELARAVADTLAAR